jgi:hypothetical protein
MRSRIRWILTASKFTLGIAIGVIASYYVGSWADARCATGSILSALFVLLAIGAGFYNLFRYITREFKNSN